MAETVPSLLTSSTNKKSPPPKKNKKDVYRFVDTKALW